MLGPSLLLAWIAHITFWVLIVWAWLTEELGPLSCGLFLVLWFGGFFGLPYVLGGASLFLSYVAILDIALVFLLFKGDLRIT